jgi:hypothetical protein
MSARLLGTKWRGGNTQAVERVVKSETTLEGACAPNRSGS